MRDEPVDWGRLVPHTVHPVRVAAVEAMLWIGEPFSAADLDQMYEESPGLPVIAYHLRVLAFGLPVLCLYRVEEVRGTHRSLYFFRDRTPVSSRRRRAA